MGGTGGVPAWGRERIEFHTERGPVLVELPAGLAPRLKADLVSDMAVHLHDVARAIEAREVVAALMATHELKTWPLFFEHLRRGVKPFEVRRDDRGFAVGDVLVLREWLPEHESYTGAELRRRVVYVLPGGHWGIKPGFVVMGLEPLEGTT